MDWPRTGLFRINWRGVKIYMKKGTWLGHIVIEHPRVNRCLGDIMEIIEHPDLVFKAGTNKFYSCGQKRRGIWIVVIYKVYGDTGSVQTAFPPKYDPRTHPFTSNRVWPIRSKSI